MNNNRLIKCFVETLGIPPDQINDNLQYNAIKQWDSVAHMALVAAIEEEFSIMLDTDDILNISSVATAREILKKYSVTSL
jgi:acyl carrier protein